LEFIFLLKQRSIFARFHEKGAIQQPYAHLTEQAATNRPLNHLDFAKPLPNMLQCLEFLKQPENSHCTESLQILAAQLSRKSIHDSLTEGDGCELLIQYLVSHSADFKGIGLVILIFHAFFQKDIRRFISVLLPCLMTLFPTLGI
jgi:hypothetical protein